MKKETIGTLHAIELLTNGAAKGSKVTLKIENDEGINKYNIEFDPEEFFDYVEDAVENKGCEEDCCCRCNKYEDEYDINVELSHMWDVIGQLSNNIRYLNDKVNNVHTNNCTISSPDVNIYPALKKKEMKEIATHTANMILDTLYDRMDEYAESYAIKMDEMLEGLFNPPIRYDNKESENKVQKEDICPRCKDNIDDTDNKITNVYENILRRALFAYHIKDNEKEFDPSTDDGCYKIFNEECYLCIKKKSFDNIVNDLYEEKDAAEIINMLNSGEYIHRNKHSMCVEIKKVKMIALIIEPSIKILTEIIK